MWLKTEWETVAHCVDKGDILDLIVRSEGIDYALRQNKVNGGNSQGQHDHSKCKTYQQLEGTIVGRKRHDLE